MKLDPSVIRTIAGLGMPISPTGILRPAVLATFMAVAAGVVPIIVNAVYRESLAPFFMHIIAEIGERHPTAANTNAPSAVALKTRVVRVAAPLLHPTPRLMHRVSESFATTSSTMHSSRLSGPHALVATTRVGAPRQQSNPMGDELRSTIASAPPIDFGSYYHTILQHTLAPLKAENSCPSEFLINEVLASERDTINHQFSFTHGEYMFGVSAWERRQPFLGTPILQGGQA